MAIMDATAQVVFFSEALLCTPSPLEISQFGAELLVANLAVSDAALNQVAATASAAGAAPTDPRGAVWAEYHRRVGEMERLFGVFFVFESAWRTIAAAVLRRRYGGDDSWWHPVRIACLAQRSRNGVGFLGGVPVRSNVVKRIANVLDHQSPAELAGMVTSYDLLEACTLGDVQWFIDQHYTDVKSLFSAGVANLPTSSVFNAQFKRVRRARNDVYHHRPTANPAAVAAAAETLLNLLDVHLGSKLALIAATATSRFAVTVPHEARHG